MRKIVAMGALLLAACSDNSATNNNAVAGDGGSDQVTAVNDTTAIDAATGEAANMAADVNYTINEPATNEASTRPSKVTNEQSNRSSTAPSFEPDEPGTANNSAD